MSLKTIVMCLLVGGGVGEAQVQLNIQPGLQLSWLTNTSDTYQLQWSSNAVTTWTNPVAAVVCWMRIDNVSLWSTQPTRQMATVALNGLSSCSWHAY